jgi:predicted hydrocarbon binding protein
MGAPLLFNKLIFSRQFEYRNGRFFLMSGIPGAIVPLEVFVKLVKKLLEDKEEKALYDIAYTQGVSAGKRYKQTAVRSVNEFMGFVKGIAEVVGMGSITFRRFDSKSITLTINPSPLAEEWIKFEKKSKTPICHYLLGIAAGCFSGYFGKRWVGKEIACKAMGNTYCEFQFNVKK